MRIRILHVLYIISPAPWVMYSICSMMWSNDAAKDVHPHTLDAELTPGTADSSPSSHQHIIPDLTLNKGILRTLEDFYSTLGL